MSGFVCIVFMSFQILSLLGSSMSNGHLAAKNDNRASSPEKILHAGIYPDRQPQKCCTLATQIYSFYENNCSSLSDNETRILTAQISQLLPFLNSTPTIGCAVSIILNELNGENYTLLENGMLHEHFRNKTHDHDHFCVDYIREYERFMPIVCVYNSTTEESEQTNYFSNAQKSALADGWKSNDPETTKSEQFRKQYLYVLGLSTMFLIITLCLYLILPELHHTEFDWSLMCHIASLIIGFCCFIAGSNVSNNNAVCASLAYMSQFWILSSFCWLNVMGIYLWRSMFPQKLSGTFYIVFLYAVGFPVFVFIVTFLATKLNTPDGFIKPVFGKTCWFQEHGGDFWFNPKFIYFYNTVIMTITINLGLFIRIAFKILFQNPGWKPTIYQDEQRYDHLPMRFFLCLKLFFIMGLSWIADMVSFLVNEEELEWRLKNLAVLLHGIFIFISFVGNERVITILLKRFSVGKRFKCLNVEKKVIFIPDNTNACLNLVG